MFSIKTTLHKTVILYDSHIYRMKSPKCTLLKYICFHLWISERPPEWQPDWVPNCTPPLKVPDYKDKKAAGVLPLYKVDRIPDPSVRTCCCRPVQPPPSEAPDHCHAGRGEADWRPISAGHRPREAQVHHPPGEEQPPQRAGDGEEEGRLTNNKLNTAFQRQMGGTTLYFCT